MTFSMLTVHSTKISSKATKLTVTSVNNPDEVFVKKFTSTVYQLAKGTNASFKKGSVFNSFLKLQVPRSSEDHTTHETVRTYRFK